MTQAQRTQRIYALGSRLGILENGNKHDLLHNLVFRISGKERIRDLSENEYKAVVNELITQLKLDNLEEPNHAHYSRKKYESFPGMISVGQQKMVWKLMYELKSFDLDTDNREASLGFRLCSIIKKELHIDATPEQPFRWISHGQGCKLIEILKKYIHSAQRRKESVSAATETD